MSKKRQHEQRQGENKQTEGQAAADSSPPAPLYRQLLVGSFFLIGLSTVCIYLQLLVEDYIATISILLCFGLFPLAWLDNTREKWLGTGGRTGIWLGLTGGFLLSILAYRAVVAGVDFDVVSTVRNAPYQLKPYLISFSDGVVRQDLAGRFTGIKEEVTVAPVVPDGWTQDRPVTLWVTGRKGRLPDELPALWQRGERGGLLYPGTLDRRRSQAHLAIEDAMKYHGLVAMRAAGDVVTLPGADKRPNLQGVVILEWQQAPLKLGRQREIVFWAVSGLLFASWLGYTLLRHRKPSLFHPL